MASAEAMIVFVHLAALLGRAIFRKPRPDVSAKATFLGHDSPFQKP
jgi:hypothetical protein